MRMTLAMTLTWKLKFTKLHGHASATATRYTIAGRLGTESLPSRRVAAARWVMWCSGPIGADRRTTTFSRPKNVDSEGLRPAGQA